MATIAEAIRAHVLEPFELPAWEIRMPIRSLWVASFEFWNWYDNEPRLELEEGGRMLLEHIEQTFCDFRCSNPFGAGVLRRMSPDPSGIRKLHPPKVRIYGWCPSANQFVAVTGAMEADTKSDRNLNDRKRDEVTAFINQNQLGDYVLLGDNIAVFPPEA